MTVIPLRPRTSRSWRERVLLALSILNHRRFCPACERHVEQARQALQGKNIDQITKDGE